MSTQRAKPDREWLVNAIEVFMGAVPGEDDRPWASTEMADHILGNWLTIEDAVVRNRMQVEAAREAQHKRLVEALTALMPLMETDVAHEEYGAEFDEAEAALKEERP